MLNVENVDSLECQVMGKLVADNASEDKTKIPNYLNFNKTTLKCLIIFIQHDNKEADKKASETITNNTQYI